jgi:glycosyltransferase involved in cell wall biosynthesis
VRAIVSCSGKFHAFALSEQLHRFGMLSRFYTTYAWQKNRLMRRWAGRVDRENIPPGKIGTLIPLAVMMKLYRQEFLYNDWYDRAVAFALARSTDYDVFIGWSGMSHRALLAAKKAGKIGVLERGSSHILHQNDILQQEYASFGIDFSIDPRVIEKELKEYETCDYIAVPSSFVEKSFLEKGVPKAKLFKNPYGAGARFQAGTREKDGTFRILYLGSLNIRKGLRYLFQALDRLNIPDERFEVWFVGGIAAGLQAEIGRYRRPNRIFRGHVPQHELPNLIAQCDVAVQPSLEEGLSMVILQMLGCGIPVIATTNTGGMDVIKEGETGFIVPIRSPEAIAEKLMYCYHNPEHLERMKGQAAASVREGFTWDDYGERYAAFLKKLL